MNMPDDRASQLHRTKVVVLTLTAVALVGCSGGGSASPADESDAETSAMASGAGATSAGDTSITLKGALTFTSEERNADGTPGKGASYSRRFSSSCTFSQPAITWKNSETGTDEFRLAETEPGVVESDASGTAEAIGDAVVRDLEHEPVLTETSTVRLRGAVTYCLIRRLEPAQFGVGYDIELDFQVALSGTVQTSTQMGSASSVAPRGGLALPSVLAPDPSAPDGRYSLLDQPGNTGMHLHAAPLLLRPAIGSRPEGVDAEIELQQQVHDGLSAHPQTAWLGLKFDPEKRIWTFGDQHTTASGAVHSVQVRIEVVP